MVAIQLGHSQKVPIAFGVLRVHIRRKFLGMKDDECAQ